MNLLDILSTSPHYFCRNWIGATNENSNFDLGVQRVKRCLRSHLVRLCYKRLNLGSYETVLRVQHGNWIVATHWLLDSLCWKKCSCLNINIFIRRCAVPSSCAQPHQSASCFDQPVIVALVYSCTLPLFQQLMGRAWSLRSHGHFDAVLFIFLRNLYRLN